VERKPFVPRPDRRLPDERRTYGDYLGVVGVLRAFGSVYGEQVEPELLTASQTVPQLLEEDASFYSIASDKVNDWTPRLMEKLQNGRSPNWMFAARPGEEDKPRADAEYAIHSDGRTMDPLYPREARPPYSEKSYEDYGLIVRGPKPGHPGRMLTVLAGAHSLGTGAACLAATKSDLVEKIQKQLGSKCDLSTCEQTMWALVKGVSDGDRHIDAKGVSIVDAGVY
jgi:hypothetical protein